VTLEVLNPRMNPNHRRKEPRISRSRSSNIWYSEENGGVSMFGSRTPGGLKAGVDPNCPFTRTGVPLITPFTSSLVCHYRGS
jgi:hypothetical protein